jgi:hypothetical protein
VSRFVVVLTASSAVRVAKNNVLLIKDAPLDMGLAQVAWFTRWADEGFASPVPRELWIEVQGEASNLDVAIGTLGEVGRLFTPVLTLVANASIDDPEVVVAFDASAGVGQREFFQALVPNEPDFPRIGREVDAELVGPTLEALLRHVDSPRIHRAAVQYHEALKYWTPGQDLAAVSHLWMAVEALTKAALRAECAARGVDEDGLASAWSIEKKQLDAEVRRRLIFSGDSATYTQAKTISDGLEHGFANFPDLHPRAAEVRDALAAHVRSAILALLTLDPPLLARLTSQLLVTVKLAPNMRRSIRGRLVGSGEVLADEGNPYPWVDWRSRIAGFSERPGGLFDVTPSDTVTLRLGPGITFEGSYEVSGFGTLTGPVQVVRVPRDGNATDLAKTQTDEGDAH